MMEKQCPVCHKKFETNIKNQIYCGKECYRKAQRFFYLENFRPKKKQKKAVVPFGVSIAKLWDKNDPECKETMAFIRTIKPLNFSEV